MPVTASFVTRLHLLALVVLAGLLALSPTTFASAVFSFSFSLEFPLLLAILDERQGSPFSNNFVVEIAIFALQAASGLLLEVDADG